MKKSYLLLMILAYSWVYSQTNTIQDSNGETSLQTVTNLITLNLTEAKMAFSFSPLERTNQNKVLWNITGALGSKEGITSVFEKRKLNLNGKLGVQFITVADTFNGENGIKHWFFGAEVLYSKCKVFDSIKEFTKQVYTKNSLGLRINLGWNKQFSRKAFSYGIALAAGIKDNSDVLEPLEVVTSSNHQLTNGEETRVLSSTQNAYDSKVFQQNRLFSNINFDFGKYLDANQRFFTNLHFNYAFLQNSKPVLNPALGLFYTQPHAPLEAVLGFQLQIEDWSNTQNSKDTRWDRAALVITAGFPFN